MTGTSWRSWRNGGSSGADHERLCGGDGVGGGRGEPAAGQSGDRELLGELLQARLSVRRYAVNVNQGIAALHSGAGVPVWLEQAAAGCDRSVARLDELTALLLQRRS